MLNIHNFFICNNETKEMLVNAIKEIGVNPKTKEEYAKYKTSIQKIINNLNNNKM
jgi:hypothetical protein